MPKPCGANANYTNQANLTRIFNIIREIGFAELMVRIKKLSGSSPISFPFLVGDVFGAGGAEVALWSQVGLAVGIHHKAAAVVVGAMWQPQETVTEFMQDDFPEL